mmetsp:Transcript_50864/g.157714  ORF Transcript_50864/g.157714 Transcript_50864/m.157714 type:complete len:259 (+) Transcript_50864:508-1284(+)
MPNIIRCSMLCRPSLLWLRLVSGRMLLLRLPDRDKSPKLVFSEEQPRSFGLLEVALTMTGEAQAAEGPAMRVSCSCGRSSSGAGCSHGCGVGSCNTASVPTWQAWDLVCNRCGGLAESPAAGRGAAFACSDAGRWLLQDVFSRDSNISSIRFRLACSDAKAPSKEADEALDGYTSDIWRCMASKRVVRCRSRPSACWRMASSCSLNLCSKCIPSACRRSSNRRPNCVMTFAISRTALPLSSTCTSNGFTACPMASSTA